MAHRKIIITGIAAFLFSTAFSTDHLITPYYSIRSQGANAARHWAGWTNHIHQFDMGAFYGSFSFTPEYSRTFRSDRITRCLFGIEDKKECPTITVSGSQASNRKNTDWLADYFYLPTDFKSALSFEPIIDNFLVDFNFYAGLDDWVTGLYFYAYAPLVHSRWNLSIKECISEKGTNSHCAGYFTPATLERKNLLPDAKSFFDGQIPDPVTQTIEDVDFDTTDVDFTTCFARLRKARLSCRRKSRTRLADIRAAVGINVTQTERHHFGFNLQVAAPTGNRPEGKFLFEPIIGNGHHWELGGAVNAHGTFYVNEDEQMHCGLYGEANVTHLFAARQKRTFDLRQNGQFSRYVLTEKLSTPVKQNLKGDGTKPTAQFKRVFQPLANLSTVPVDVKGGVQVDLMLMLNYTWSGFAWDVGYNFWARTCENITIRGITEIENNMMWALKGDVHVYGFLAQDDNPLKKNFPVALSATQNTATINSGTNSPLGTTNFTVGKKNPNIDTAELATGGTNNRRLLFAPDEANSEDNQIKTSIQPVFPQVTDLNICDARTRGMSSKFFTHISYTWDYKERYQPYFGVGGEVEVDHGDNECKKSDCIKGECVRCALSQWGIWFKGGISFE